MILVTAQMWPHGNVGAAYEVANVTITQKETRDDGNDYFAHVLTRPKPEYGIAGYEADVEVHGHKYQNGLAPLLISVLAAAHNEDRDSFFVPPSRSLAHVVLTQMHEFEQKLKGRP